MKNFRLLSVCLLMLAVIIWQCKSNSGTAVVTANTDTSHVAATHVDDFKASFDSTQKGIPVFYNMYLTVDMSKLFMVEGAPFTPEWLNPVSNASSYSLSGKKALNLGVYAVDLSYIRTFGQTVKARPCFEAMRNLSKDLGIPDNFVNRMSDRFDRNIDNKDSMMNIANEIYHTTNKYLKDNDRGSSSVLIILGGWTEAMSIAAKISAEKPANLELKSKIADQKASLTDLLSLLQENKSDSMIGKILPAVTELKSAYDALVFDEKNPTKSEKQFKLVSEKINNLRSLIIN